MALTHSANLAAKQSRGLDQTLATARRRLTELQARLARGRTRRDRAKVEAEIAAIRRPRWVADIITVTLTGEGARRAATDLAHRRPRPRPARGAPVRQTGTPFTNRDWPVPDIVAAYRSQSDAEFGFRQLKDPHVVSFSPMHQLDRLQDPGARVLLRARPRRRPPDAPPRRPRRPAHVARELPTTSPASKKPSCSTTTAPRDARACNACSPT